ncbi:hypothetical protein [Shewanella sp. Shew256]|uniref:hypothetical protein n=1 Tax=Shewanella sp. Shew256 TaxID=1969376 RepID=UPI000B499C19|nr:hypothetical protein [Shewanella sp. Shew256]
MVDKTTLKTTNIHQDDRQTLHQYGFSDFEIDRLRQWVMSSPWEINEVNAVYDKLAEMKANIDAFKKTLLRLTATLPALTLELNHLNKQFSQNASPSLIEGFSFMDSSQTPDAKQAEQELLSGLSSLESTIKHQLQICKAPMLFQYNQTLMEIKETTGKERLLLSLRSIWAQKHPEDLADASANFINFIAILFMSSDNKDVEVVDHDTCKGWWNKVRKPELKNAKRLRFPIISFIDDQGNKTYLASPPKLNN